jgi:hypothetical protein
MSSFGSGVRPSSSVPEMIFLKSTSRTLSSETLLASEIISLPSGVVLQTSILCSTALDKGRPKGKALRSAEKHLDAVL